MAAFDDIAKKATEFLHSDQAKNALNSKKAEEVTDKLLDGVAGFANKVTGGKHEEAIAGLRAKADGTVGPDGTGETGTTGGTDKTARTGGTDASDDRTDGTLGPDGTRHPN